MLKLPARMVTEQELAEAQAQVAELAKDPTQQRIMLWHQAVIDRYHEQQPSNTQDAEVHVLRIGDIAVCTNPFELFLDFGVQMKSRSPALQTFVIQLVHGAGYLPTADAVRGGGYSAIVQSSEVGPEGGQVLADKSVEMIQTSLAQSSVGAFLFSILAGWLPTPTPTRTRRSGTRTRCPVRRAPSTSPEYEKEYEYREGVRVGVGVGVGVG